jgi:hypothetical protein
VKLHRMLGMKASQSLPWKEIVAEVPNVVEAIEKIENQKKVVRISPFIEEEPQRAESIEHGAETTDGRPWFDNDYHKYDWLMTQQNLSQDDLDWIEDFKSHSSLYKHVAQG